MSASRSLRGLVAAVLTLLASTASLADPLPPGSTARTSPVTLAARPALAGTSEADVSLPFAFVTGTGFVSGTVQHAVVRSIDGSLDFYWRIRVDAGSTGRVNRLTVYGFHTDPSSLLLADYRADGIGSAPSDWAERSPGDGATIGFVLHNGVGAKQVSNALLLDTKERAFGLNGKLVLEGVGGGTSASQATYVPLH